MLNLAQKQILRKIHPYLYECVDMVEKAVNSIAKQTGADPVGIFKATPNITAVNVTSANGLFNVQIVDNAFINNPVLQGRAITYFVEFATDAGFQNIVHTESLHAVRNVNVFLGNQTLFVRAYSQVQGSAPSTPIAFGNPPTSLVGGGVAPPAQQAYQGSGTSANSGQGYGSPIRSAGNPGAVGRAAPS